MRRHNRFLLLTAISMIVLTNMISCKKEVSRATGWQYNDPRTGGFEVAKYQEQEIGPGLVFIEGGTFVMGRTTDDVMLDWNNLPRRVTVSSFYMDETEVSNKFYMEYLYWLNRVFGEVYPQVYTDALPDTLVWLDPLAYNEPYVQNYLRHPAYHDYPVVGVSWVQASNYASWRTDRVNEMILIREGILDWNPNQKGDDHFTTQAYLAGEYEGMVRRNRRDLNPTGTGERRVRQSDGLLLPSYRLPTEAEWEYAALGLIGNTIDERIVERRQYPWDGTSIRSNERRTRGVFMANVQRGRGDMMGVAGNLNDGGEITVPVFSYWPNDFGLYNMAGNVNEWVQDVYRPLSHETVADFRPFRGSNYRDGDLMSNLLSEQLSAEERAALSPAEQTQRMYSFGETSLINDESRVYKGGSWRDRVYWINPGTRRFLDQNASANDIGFRCAMTRVGSPTLNKR